MGGLCAFNGVGRGPERRTGQSPAQHPVCRRWSGRIVAGGRGNNLLRGWWQAAFRSGPQAGHGQVGGESRRVRTACDCTAAGPSRRSHGTPQAQAGGGREAGGPVEGQARSGREDRCPSREAGQAGEARLGTNSGAREESRGRETSTRRTPPRAEACSGAQARRRETRGRESETIERTGCAEAREDASAGRRARCQACNQQGAGGRRGLSAWECQAPQRRAGRGRSSLFGCAKAESTGHSEPARAGHGLCSGWQCGPGRAPLQTLP